MLAILFRPSNMLSFSYSALFILSIAHSSNLLYLQESLSRIFTSYVICMCVYMYKYLYVYMYMYFCSSLLPTSFFFSTSNISPIISHLPICIIQLIVSSTLSLLFIYYYFFLYICLFPWSMNAFKPPSF